MSTAESHDQFALWGNMTLPELLKVDSHSRTYIRILKDAVEGVVENITCELEATQQDVCDAQREIDRLELCVVELKDAIQESKTLT